MSGAPVVRALIAPLATCLLLGACTRLPEPSEVVPRYDASGLEPRVAAKIERVETAVLEDLDGAASWGRLGMIFQAHALYPQAIACYERAESLDPADYRWPYLSGVALAGTDLDGALEAYDRALGLSPDNPGVYLDAAETAGERGDFVRAREIYRLLLERDGDSPFAHLGLARLHLAAGELDEARSRLLAALRSESRLGEAHRLLASVYRREGNHTLAADHEELARAFPSSARPPDPATAAMRAEAVSSRSYTERGQSLAARGLYAEAETQFREVLRIRDPNVRDLTNLGGALAGQGRVDGALAMYHRALELDPDDPVAHNNLGMALVTQSRSEEAETALRTALELDSGYAKAHANLGLLLSRTARDSEAVVHLERAIDLDPGLASAHNDLAAVLDSLDRRDEALRVRQRALRVAPSDPSLRYNLALALARDGRHQEAIEQLRAGARLAPNSSRFASLLAWELATAPSVELRDGDEAVRLARRVYEAYAGDPSSADILAAALAESGDFEEAETIARRALGLAQRAANRELAGEIERRLDLYRRGLPFRQQG